MGTSQPTVEVLITSLYQERWITDETALLRVRLEIIQEQISPILVVHAFLQLLEEFPALRKFTPHGKLRGNMLQLDLDAIIVAGANSQRIEAFFLLVSRQLKQLLSPQPVATFVWKRTRA